MTLKRILLISSNSSGRGGGERYLLYLARGLRNLGYEVHALLSSIGYMDQLANSLAAEGVEVHRRNLKGLRQRPLRFVQSITDTGQQRQIASICKDIAPDAILVNQQYDEDGLDYIAGAIKAKVAPVGATMHMPMTATKHLRPFGSLRGKLLSWWYQRHPYSLILVSRGARREFQSYYEFPFKLTVVHYGCPFDEIAPSASPDINLPAEWSDPTIPVVGFSGQFVPQKNLQLLIEGWLYAREQGSDTRLLLIGDGPERENIERRLARSAPPLSWHITGWQNQPEAFLLKLDVYMMTSHFEGLPLALLEAAGRGLPTVVTDFNGARDVAERASWVSVAPASSHDAVGNTLTHTIRDLNSLKEQAKVGMDKFQEYFSLERMAQDTLTALKGF